MIRLRVCAGWSEALLVAHTTLLEISCTGSFDISVNTDQVGVGFEADTLENENNM